MNNSGEARTFSRTLTGTGDYTEFVTTVTVSDGTAPPKLDGKTLNYAGGDQAFILNPNGQILDDATFSLRLGQAEADVYVIATNTAHHPMSPHVEQLGRAGRTAGRLAQAAAESIAMVPQRSWVTEFNNSADLPMAGACGQQQPARQGNTAHIPRLRRISRRTQSSRPDPGHGPEGRHGRHHDADRMGSGRKLDHKRQRGDGRRGRGPVPPPRQRE